jgi:uncharacterized protein
MRSYITARLTVGFIVLVTASLVVGRERGERKYAPFPEPDAGYVTDLADLLSDKQERQLERWLQRTEEESRVEIIVVTIESIRDYRGAPQRNIERFARALFDAYGIGNLPRNDGVLLLVARRDRSVRIELGAGYGRAKDGVAMRIMARKILPRFYKDRYARGIMQGTRTLMSEFGGVYVLPSWAPWALGGIGVAMIPVAISLFRHGKRGWGWIVVGLILVLVLAGVWLSRRVIEGIGEGRSGPGGLGGFGGGFSGGGGATGRW